MDKIDSILHTAVKNFPDALAIDDSKIQLTYAVLYERVASCYSNLQSKINPWERVALSSDYKIETIVLLFALLYNNNLTALIAPDEPTKSLIHKLEILKPDHTIGLNENLDEKYFQKSNSHLLPSTHDLTRPATIVFTSGSTGTPKGVVHTLGNHYYSALGSNENIKLSAGDRWLLSLPLYHISGLAILFRCFLSGTTVVIDSSEKLLSDKVKSHNVTHLSIVPAQLIDLLEASNSKLNSLKTVLLGGSAAPSSLIKKAIEHKIPLCTTYGMSETSSQLTTTAPDDPPEKLFTSGKLLNYRQLKFTSDGEIMVAGDVLFDAYLSENEKRARGSITADGSFATGDIGQLDNDGYLTVTGRKDNMFISGGENIHPEPLEGTLCLLDKIKDVLIVPLADQKFGHRPAAFIKWVDNNQQLTLDEINQKLLLSFPPFCKLIKLFDWPKINPPKAVKSYRLEFIKIAGELD